MEGAGERYERVPTGVGDEWLVVGRGGWIFWHLPEWHDVRVRVARGFGGRRLVISALMLEVQKIKPPKDAGLGWFLAGTGISATDLRGLPLGRLEAIINTPENTNTVTALLTARRGPDYSPAHCAVGEAYSRSRDLPLRAQDFALELPVPTSRSNSEEFFAGVAEVYSRALISSDHPVEAVAEANSVPKATVNRWLREARRLGILAPAKRETR